MMRKVPFITGVAPLLNEVAVERCSVNRNRNFPLLRALQFCFFHATKINLKKSPSVTAQPIMPVRFQPQYPYDGKYTTEPLPTRRTGGRHPETGRRIWARIGGGTYRPYYWVDRIRANIPENETIEERVLEIRGDRSRSAFLALIAHGDEKRWIMATQGMKPGDTIKSSRKIEALPVSAVDGDTHPVGALALGTVVCSIELLPGHGQKLVQAAGGCALVARKLGDQVVIRLTNKREISVNEKCLVTVGKMSNPEHSSNKYLKAGQRRAEGFRPRSGLWTRKDGYCGRKVHPLPPVRKFDLSDVPKSECFLQLTRPRDTRFWVSNPNWKFGG